MLADSVLEFLEKPIKESGYEKKGSSVPPFLCPFSSFESEKRELMMARSQVAMTQGGGVSYTGHKKKCLDTFQWRKCSTSTTEEESIDHKRLSRVPNHAFARLFQAGGVLSCASPLPTRTVPNEAMYLNGAPNKQHHDTIRFVCISDTHGRHRSISHMPPGDVLLHGGDITNSGELEQLEDFSSWLGKLAYKHKVVIAGNHDITLDPAFYAQETNRKRFHRHKTIYNIASCRAALKNCIWLEDDLVCVEGYTIYGSPWQPTFYDWAFNLDRGLPCRQAWSKIPKKGVDILLTHGPPIGYGDQCSGGNRAGCVDLLHTIHGMEKPPLCHVFGHIHEGDF